MREFFILKTFHVLHPYSEPHSSPPPVIKRGDEILKNGCNGGGGGEGGWEIFTRNGGSQEWGGGWFKMGGLEIFKVFLHSWQRVANPPFLWRPPHSPYCQPPLFQILSTTPTTSLSPPAPTPTVLSGVLFLSLNGWTHHIWCAILLNDNMDLYVQPWYLSSLGTMMCVLCNKASNLLGSET